MKKIGKLPAIPTNIIPAIIAELFPTHPIIEEEGIQQLTMPIPAVTLQELKLASTRLYPEKAAGPDGTPNETLKVAVKTHPKNFQGVYGPCMIDGRSDPKTMEASETGVTA
jgi:hypothetical protein